MTCPLIKCTRLQAPLGQKVYTILSFPPIFSRGHLHKHGWGVDMAKWTKRLSSSMWTYHLFGHRCAGHQARWSHIQNCIKASQSPLRGYNYPHFVCEEVKAPRGWEIWTQTSVSVKFEIQSFFVWLHNSAPSWPHTVLSHYVWGRRACWVADCPKGTVEVIKSSLLNFV